MGRTHNPSALPLVHVPLSLPLHTDTLRFPGKGSYTHYTDKASEIQKDDHTIIHDWLSLSAINFVKQGIKSTSRVCL